LTAERVDVVVVGGGIVGLATARAIADADPALAVVVLEKEHDVARHQTGRNSGVLHSGIYYRPGSMKAQTARVGRLAMERYCDERGVPYERCGKVIVAVREAELPRLAQLEARAEANGVRAERIGPAALAEIEPAAAGIAALHVRDTGVVDFGAVAHALRTDLEGRGVRVLLGHGVSAIHERGTGVVAVATSRAFTARALVNCAGLHADRLAAEVLGPAPDVRIVPFRGEYYDLAPDAARLVRHLIYPVPDPDLPFLGVHLSRGIDGGVHAGPNAVLALAREGYSWKAVEPAELRDLVTYPGFRPLARRYWRVGVAEVARSLSRRLMARSLGLLVPGITADSLVPRPAGVRAQALTRDGTLLDDFRIVETARCVHVLNAPSPGATASLTIGGVVAARVKGRLTS
jgi:L-2-hydroxyglutarate oxidase